jgi:ribosomal protein S27AE
MMSYTCPKCGRVSYNPSDEVKRYCGACHAFEEDWGWLVWSFEHGAWWGPGKCGYTRSLNKAGRYTRLEALEICDEANRYSKEVNEAMVHQSELREAAK